MRLLKHGLGKRSPLFFNFNAGVSFNNPIDFKTPVTAPITENASSSPSPSPGITPADRVEDVFSSVDPDTVYSVTNSVSSLKPWTPDDSANAWAGLGAFGTDGNTSLSFGTDGNIDFSGKPSNVYEKTEEQNRKTEEAFRKLKEEEQKANAKMWEEIIKTLGKIAQLVPKEFSGIGTA
jgi:hypothetical protein